MVDTSAPQTNLGHDEAVPLAAQHVIDRHADIREAEIGVRRIAIAVADVANDLEARRPLGDDEN